MATLQGIPRSYYEAAEIEGAGFWRKIWTISLPRLRPVISMLLIFALIGSSQAFEQQMIMTEGGPGGASRTVVLYLYTLLQQLRYADATALGVYLFLVVMAIVVIYRLFVDDDPDAPSRRRLGRAQRPATALRRAGARDETDDQHGAARQEPAGGLSMLFPKVGRQQPRVRIAWWAVVAILCLGIAAPPAFRSNRW